MSLSTKIFELPNEEPFLKKALHWADSFSHFHYFTNCNYKDYLFGTFPNMLAVGAFKKLSSNKDCFKSLEQFLAENPSQWITGYLSYDLKNELERLESLNPEIIPSHLLEFYIPQHIINFHDDKVEIKSNEDATGVFEQITSFPNQKNETETTSLNLNPGVSKNEYVENIKSIRNQIEEGDFYEMNYCMSLVQHAIEIDPVSTFLHLKNISPMPFSVLQKSDDRYALCASPERFLKKEGNKLISQPIKGTIKRGNTPEENFIQKLKLAGSEKEQAENLMIVDLVRNDLSKSSRSGSVKVAELFGIYEFKTINQMISSVESRLKDDVLGIDVLKNAFPMGSMTGAPKIEVMKNIDRYENFRRGLFSGAIGYFTPTGDFDFNVVIRTIFYDKKNKLVNFKVGSAITYDSIPEKEYEECLLKIESLSKALS